VAYPLSDNELGVFLRSRRERISPAEAGLTLGNRARRTPGLRREEVATLAGVSIDYYTRLERGRERRPSTAVLGALSAVLKLDEAEWRHVHALAGHAAGNGVSGPTPKTCVRETARLLLESLRPSPAAVLSRVNDLLAANPAGLAIFHGLTDWPPERRNLTRFLFLHPGARSLWIDWEVIAAGHVAHLRSVAGQNPDAPDIVALIDDLLMESPDFARLWARYDVKPRTAGDKRFEHARVGRMTLGYESLPLPGAGEQRLVVYLARPGTPDHDAMMRLDLLAAGQSAAQLLVPPADERRAPSRPRPLCYPERNRLTPQSPIPRTSVEAFAAE
jgi:transcriptional regulator with XRE-family HTH domain